eukprot:8271682-Alexandrium_andersonii.AAC.1
MTTSSALYSGQLHCVRSPACRQTPSRIRQLDRHARNSPQSALTPAGSCTQARCTVLAGQSALRG